MARTVSGIKLGVFVNSKVQLFILFLFPLFLRYFDFYFARDRALQYILGHPRRLRIAEMFDNRMGVQFNGALIDG